MHFQVCNITPFDNVNGKGVMARVEILHEDDPIPNIVIHVTTNLDWDLTLEESKKAAIDEAKSMLRKAVESF